MIWSDHDIIYMKKALELAREGLGRVAPNPSVGCVIVRDGAIVGSGRTSDGGRPHAEVNALAQAGAKARGADVYVTLEPCAHHGKTGPCAEALVQAGVQRVVVACHDPDLRVDGAGLDILRESGVQVEVGLLEAEVMALQKGFFLRVTEGRPLVTLKMAVSADGKIAGAGGARVQITAQAAQEHMHRTLRATHDAILVGRGTVVRDNPLLTTRVAGVEHHPLQVVLGHNIPADTHLAQAGGVVLIDNHHVEAVLRQLAEDQGITRLLVEGGAVVMQAFLDSGLWDGLYVYRSSMVIGEGGLAAPDFAGCNLLEKQMVGPDVLEIYGHKA